MSSGGKTWRIDLAEAARYLGYPEAPDPDMGERLQSAAERVSQAARPRYVYAAWPLRPGAAGCELEDALFLPGASIARHLSGCAEGILLAATLGAGVDSLIRRAAPVDLLDSVMADACAAALTEQVMDAAEEEIHRERAGGAPVYFTSRFSPGYGDLPLRLQPDILRLLDAPRRIGLSVTESLILTPRKSVTAVIGRAAAAVPAPGRLAGAACAAAGRCPRCARRGRCPYNGR
ncbi:MAG: hypothetical protein LBS10_08615 [Gracilibacteraceae bacterium]|nr:hypothetical protein [Gracilibacteraceae bacterium]